MKRFVFLLLPLLGLGVQAQDEPRLSAELNTGEAFLGDAVTYTVSITYPGDWQIQAESLPEKLGDAKVLSQSWSEPEALPDSTLVRRILQARLAWYKLGEFQVPLQEINAVTPGGEARILTAPELPIQILNMLSEDDTEVAPSKGQVEMDVAPLWPWILGAVLLLALVVALVVYFLGKRGQDTGQKPELPPMPPYDEAIAALRELTHGSLLKEGRTKEFHVRINQIVRRYYARLFQVHAEEMTSFEMEDYLAGKKDIPEGVIDLNRGFQELCDLVKFAKHDPLEAETKQVVNAAYEIVEKLRPSETEQGSGEEAPHVATG
jgi:hypothetical protein